jgi:hypothetical protein
MERIKKRTQSLMTLMVAQASWANLSANETKARAYSLHGHGPQADQTGRIHTSDFRYPANILLRKAAGPYIWVKCRRKKEITKRSAFLWILLQNSTLIAP